MTPSELFVTAVGLAAIAWVNWYFFFARRSSVVAQAGGGLQRARIEVDNGYAPAVVRVRAGQPVRLEFHRVDGSSCTEEVVIPDFGIRRFLPNGQTTAVDFMPRAAGAHDFACGMGMVRGKIIVDE
ncbi:MAG TPA: cupredoxin domain-containing protein [Gemmatimonadales bacterium]|jgi:plastocyanin domain-containing protein|nr:cupredoxin domain-containing protein [Gemmatimonadales bacterium]